MYAPYETAAGRPDLMARVFQLKYKELLNDFLNNEILGRVKAYTWVIEFQKRGLPHAHLLLIMAPQDKPQTPADIDKVICAELPDPNDPSQAELLQVILGCQIHGPCGERNRNAPCMTPEGVCSKGYPKEDFVEQTEFCTNGYPKYRRREASPTIQKGAFDFDSRDVVPYNPYFSKKYKCHVNVEFCGSIRAVKYLYKYTYKGHDRANVEFGHDEITEYLDARYVVPPEACWRLFRFAMHDKSHTIIRLAVHVDGYRNIVFPDGAAKEALEKAEKNQSMLEAWFALNARSPEAKHFLYSQIPEYYTWNQKDSVWQKRHLDTAHGRQQAARGIGRLHTASPTDEDRYYLYLMLLHTRGATEFLDLAKAAPNPKPFTERHPVSGEEVPDLHAAAKALGLAGTPDEARVALREASAFQSAYKLRELFVHLLIHGDIGESDRRPLWDEFRESFIDDARWRHKPESTREVNALHHIRQILKRSNKDLQWACLPPLSKDEEAALGHAALQRELNYDVAEETTHANTHREKMYPEQAAAYDAIVEAIVKDTPNVFFIDGPGGAGKTFLYAALLHFTRGRGWPALACAWSGIAAVLLEGGRTCHSRFGLSVPLGDGRSNLKPM